MDVPRASRHGRLRGGRSRPAASPPRHFVLLTRMPPTPSPGSPRPHLRGVLPSAALCFVPGAVGLALLTPTTGTAQAEGRHRAPTHDVAGNPGHIPPDAPAGQRVGAFLFRSDYDRLTGRATRIAMTFADESSPSRLRALAIGCSRDNTPGVVLWHGRYFGGDSDDDIVVQYRFTTDADAAPQGYWNLLRGKRAAQMRADAVEAFAAAARTAAGAGGRVYFRATDPLDGETVDLAFSLAGLGRVLDRLGCYATSPAPADGSPASGADRADATPPTLGAGSAR